MHSSPLEEAAKGWNTPKYNLHRWPSLEVHHWATILRFLTTIWFLQFSIGSRQKKGKEIFLWEFQTFYPGIIAQIFQKSICNFKQLISPWRGPQWKLLFWAFFSTLWEIPPHQKSAFTEPPFLLLKNFGFKNALMATLTYSAVTKDISTRTY